MSYTSPVAGPVRGVGAVDSPGAGLLDNRDATTFPTDQDALQKRDPMCRVKKGQRVVTDGNLVTSAGGLASYEGAVMVVERLLGDKPATTVGAALFGPSTFAAARPAKKSHPRAPSDDRFHA